jgi:hypothetical protein
VVTRLDDPSLPQDQQEGLRKWLEVWEHRSAHLLSHFPNLIGLAMNPVAVDNTLKLLYNSATSRGLPHNLTKNLSFLMYGHRKWWMDRFFTPSGSPWNPHRPPDPIPAISPKAKQKDAKRHRWREMDDRAWNGIEDVVKMAEGRHQISLGKVLAKGPSYNLKDRANLF